MCAISAHIWVKYERVSCGIFVWCILVSIRGVYIVGVYVGVSMWDTYVGDVVYGYDVGNVENRMVTGFVACWGYGELL